MRVWPYKFELDLETYRARGALSREASNPYFDMFLIDDRATDEEFVERHRGVHVMDEHYWFGVDVRCTSAEEAKWGAVQNTVLEALRRITDDLLRDLDAGAGDAVLLEAHTRMAVVAVDHQAVWETVVARLNEAISAGLPIARFPVPQTWSTARHKREVGERNRRLGGGYASG
ncbi:hypothetical protein ACFFQW_46410 [Umezawaea endophytica]|uniref:Uncharacterized protein n=1 Tax=Umezawaea endophytica TaxID=1654476 RepID=A0A9X2VX59_9PSEU|nr:hypothetical protein [Umezawaea endophytica]MCS7483772.1 hypothetical protein [Umezawaea endophytica]